MYRKIDSRGESVPVTFCPVPKLYSARSGAFTKKIQQKKVCSICYKSSIILFLGSNCKTVLFVYFADQRKENASEE